MKKSAALQQQVKEYSPVTDWTVCVNMSELHRDIRRKEHCWGKKVGERRNTNVLEEGSSTLSNPPWHWSWHKTEVCGCRNICSIKKCLWSFSRETLMHQLPTFSYNITVKISHKIFLKTTILEFWKTIILLHFCNFTLISPLMVVCAPHSRLRIKSICCFSHCLIHFSQKMSSICCFNIWSCTFFTSHTRAHLNGSGQIQQRLSWELKIKHFIIILLCYF